MITADDASAEDDDDDDDDDDRRKLMAGEHMRQDACARKNCSTCADFVGTSAFGSVVSCPVLMPTMPTMLTVLSHTVLESALLVTHCYKHSLESFIVVAFVPLLHASCALC